MFKTGLIEIRRPPFLIPVLTYFGIYVIATIFSLSPVLSIFGIVDRSMGLINVSNLILLYFLVFNILDSKEKQLMCLKLVVLSVGLVSLLGIFQYLGKAPFHILPAAAGQRVGSTLGNPDYCTPVVLLSLPVALAFVLKKRYLFAIPFVLTVLMLLFSLPIPGITEKWIFSQPGNSDGAERPEVVQNTVEKVAGLAVKRVELRKGLWEAAIEASFHHPIIGTGPNTYRDVFTEYEPLYYVRKMPTFREDKAHNEFLEVAQSTGFTGLGVYLFMIAAVLWFFIRWVIRNIRSPNMFFVAAISLGITGYLSYTFMVFHTIAAYTLFWIFLG
ncbi:MAG: O-antigen ligase family protein, partial [Candidatus Mariimomonas ferrooxydans]